MVTLLWHSKWQYLDRYCMDMACFTHIVWLSTMMYTTQSMNISITQRNGKTDWKEFCQAGKIYQVLSNFDRILYWMKKWCYFYWHRFPLPEGPSPPYTIYARSLHSLILLIQWPDVLMQLCNSLQPQWLMLKIAKK